MKIETIKMFRKHRDDDWEAENLLDCESLFLCNDELIQIFPAINCRKWATLTVYTHAVKASKKFHIFRPYSIMGYIKGIDGINDMFPSMRRIIDEILDQCNKEKMTVWVTVE